MIQQALFDGRDFHAIDPRTLSARTDPDTSHEAATKAVASGAVGKQREVVLAALKTFGPCTACELAKWSGIDRFTCSRRLPELAGPKVRKVERLPARVCSVAGSRQTMWRVR